MPLPGKCVMYALLSHLGDSSLDLGPKFSPHLRQLAAETGADPHTVVRYIALLEEHGWLTAHKRRGCRTRYVVSAGLDFTDKARSRTPPGDATDHITSAGAGDRGSDATDHIGSDATNHNTGDATDRITYRPSTVQKTDQGSKPASAEIETGTESQSAEPGRRPANTQEADRGVMRSVASLPAEPVAGYLARAKQEKWAGDLFADVAPTAGDLFADGDS
jgi:hypothetical protein